MGSLVVQQGAHGIGGKLHPVLSEVMQGFSLLDPALAFELLEHSASPGGWRGSGERGPGQQAGDDAVKEADHLRLARLGSCGSRPSPESERPSTEGTNRQRW